MNSRTNSAVLQTSRPSALRVWFWRVILPVVGAILAGVTCWFVATSVADWPPYQARATLLIEETPDAELVGTSAEGIRIAQETIGALVVREPVTTNVADRLDLDLTARELADHVRVEIPEGAPIVEVVATHPDPSSAASIANELAEEATVIRSSLAGVSVLSPATTPESPLFSSYLLIAVAGLLGGLVTVGALFLNEQLRGKIRSEEDVIKRAQLPLLGTVAVSAASTDARASSQEWILARLLVELGTHSQNVLFTAPKSIDSQEFFLARLLQTELPTVGISAPLALEAGPLDSATKHDQKAEVEAAASDGGPAFNVPPTLSDRLFDIEVLDDPLDVFTTSPADRKVRFVNGPAVLSDAGALLLATRFDAVVLLVEADSTRVDDAQLSNTLLVESGANVLGTILLV